MGAVEEAMGIVEERQKEPYFIKPEY